MTSAPTNRHLFRALAALAIVSLSLLSVHSAPARAADSSLPTLAQIESALTTAANQTVAPDFTKTVPTLANPTQANDPINIRICNWTTTFPVDPVKSCSFGTVSAPKTIYIFGDSQSAMWIPTFNQLGIDLNFHVIYTAFSGCGPYFAFMAGGSPACVTFLNHAIAFANALQPTFVFPIGLETSALTDTFKYPQTAAMEKVVKALAPSKSKVILLGSMPHIPRQIPTCPLAHPTAIQGCETTPAQNGSTPIRETAAATHVTFVDVTPLFCSPVRCPIWAATPTTNYLVYYDGVHMNGTYAAWIAKGFETIVAPYLSLNAPIPNPLLPQAPVTLSVSSHGPHSSVISITGGTVGTYELHVTGRQCTLAYHTVRAAGTTVCTVTGLRTAGAAYEQSATSRPLALRFSL